MKYIKEVFILIFTGVALILSAFFIAAYYTVRIVTYPKNKW
jgi:hypothetical protein